MKFTALPLKSSFRISLEPFSDDRGWFARYFCKNEFSSIGFTVDWVQMNHSFSKQKGTIRGMHYQVSPFREVKLVRCVAGAVFDVIIDLRNDSPTFLQWYGLELSAENQEMLLIPEGFAHGFQCLTDSCELLYHHSAYYQPGSEAGIRYNDPLLGIRWPLELTVISDRDKSHPLIQKDFKGI